MKKFLVQVALVATFFSSCQKTKIVNEGGRSYLYYKSSWTDDNKMPINENVPKHDYDLSKLKKHGLRFTYNDPRYEIRHGIDLSRHDGEIDFAQIKDDGIEFVILRLGYRRYGETGLLVKDENFDRNFIAAKSAGLPVGIYVFSQAINDDEALEEARLVIDSLNPSDVDLPVTFDPELIGNDDARTDGIPREVFTRNALLFCEAVKVAGFQPMLYMNVYWQHKFFDLEKLVEYPIWYADYERKPQTPYHFAFWQYSAKGRVKGIKRKEVDHDLWFVPVMR